MDGLDGRVDRLSDDISDLKVELRGAVDKIGGISSDIKSSSRRNMWAVGIILTLINITADIIVLVVH